LVDSAIRELATGAIPVLWAHGALALWQSHGRATAEPKMARRVTIPAKINPGDSDPFLNLAELRLYGPHTLPPNGAVC
jgi:hypothetical protein